MKPYKRSQRVSAHIQSSLSELILRKIHDPRVKMATITGVKLSNDLRTAYVYFSVIGGEERRQQVLDGFHSSLGFIKRQLADRLGLRYMPEIRFFYDPSLDYGAKIDQVIKELAVSTEDGAN